MKILVPVDGSPASMHALDLALDQLKRVAGAGLVVVNVQNRTIAGLAEGMEMMPPEWIEEEEERAGADALENALAACRESGVSYTTRSERGPVAATIHRVAHEEGVAQIIMGTRGLGQVRGLFLGSVTTQLLHLADVPVTLVK